MTGTMLVAMAWESTLSDEATTRDRFPFTDGEILMAVSQLEARAVLPTVLSKSAPWLRDVMLGRTP